MNSLPEHYGQVLELDESWEAVNVNLSLESNRVEIDLSHRGGRVKCFPEQAAGIDGVAMDMWAAYVKLATTHAESAEIVHDRFHISKHLNEAVDKVRRTTSRRRCFLSCTYALARALVRRVSLATILSAVLSIRQGIVGSEGLVLRTGLASACFAGPAAIKLFVGFDLAAGT